MMNAIASLMDGSDMFDKLPGRIAGHPSWIEKLTYFVSSRMQRGSYLTSTHDKLYSLTEVVNNHKFKYESAVATALTNLVNSIVLLSRQQAKTSRDAASTSKVIKGNLKPKVAVKAVPPRNIYGCHLKAFFDVVAKNKPSTHNVVVNAELDTSQASEDKESFFDF